MKTHHCNGMLLLVLGLLLGLPPVESMANNRNVIFIAIDDMRVEPAAITPTLDALASVSTVYDNAYTTALWCMPARTSVMFGLSAGTHGVGLADELVNYHEPPYSSIYANPSVLSLPEVLNAAGYTTAVTGKVFHDPQPSRWDFSGPAIINQSVFDGLDPTPNGTFMAYGPTDPEEELHPDQEIADWASDFIESHSGSPFFLAVGFFQPHLPWIPPQWAFDLYPAVNAHSPLAGDLDDEPAKAVDYARAPVLFGITQHTLVEWASAQEEITRAYLASISHTDSMIGQVLAALDASEHAADTDVIIWSDHGFHLGEKFHWRKRTYWQPTVQVPLLIRSPSLPQGVVSSPVSLLDLAPTVLDLVGLPARPQFEGTSLRTGASPVVIHHENGEATVTGSIKNIDYDTTVPGILDIASYDLASDPQETVNLTPPPPGC